MKTETYQDNFAIFKNHELQNLQAQLDRYGRLPRKKKKRYLSLIFNTPRNSVLIGPSGKGKSLFLENFLAIQSKEN